MASGEDHVIAETNRVADVCYKETAAVSDVMKNMEYIKPRTMVKVSEDHRDVMYDPLHHPGVPYRPVLNTCVVISDDANSYENYSFLINWRRR